jgi:hypothetical protein
MLGKKFNKQKKHCKQTRHFSQHNKSTIDRTKKVVDDCFIDLGKTIPSVDQLQKPETFTTFGRSEFK